MLDLANLKISNWSCHYSEAVAWRWSVKKVFLTNFAKFTGKHLFRSLFIHKVGRWGWTLGTLKIVKISILEIYHKTMSQKPQITEYWKRAFKFGLFVEEVFLLSLKAFFFFFKWWRQQFCNLRSFDTKITIIYEKVFPKIFSGYISLRLSVAYKDPSWPYHTSDRAFIAN